MALPHRYYAGLSPSEIPKIIRCVCKELFDHDPLHFTTSEENLNFQRTYRTPQPFIAPEIFTKKNNYTSSPQLVLETRLECVGIVLIDAGADAFILGSLGPLVVSTPLTN